MFIQSLHAVKIADNARRPGVAGGEFQRYFSVMKTEIETIDAYIAQFPADIQALLRTMRRTIAKAAPDAVEKISYGMPTFFLEKNLVHFAAMKHHLGFYPTASGVANFAEALSPYKTSKGAVQFPYGEPLPTALVEAITKFRVKENLAASKK